jgi:hypothetical protein
MDVQIECPCPARPDGSPRHAEGDTVVLHDRLDFRSAITIRKAVGLVGEDGPANPAEILATMTEWYCLLGIESWTLTDKAGKALPVSRQAIRAAILENPDAFDQATAIADAADELYTSQVLLPLLAAASKSSPPTPTAPSTSAPTASSPKHRKPSRRSSTTSTQTVAIVGTSSSRAGDSSTSPRSASAA